MDSTPKIRSYNLDKNPVHVPNGYPMSPTQNSRQRLTRGEYAPIGSSRKLNLLLQRSFRYSYRQRCCGCCPTILCELLFPLILLAILMLSRYGTNALVRELNDNPDSVPTNSNRAQCSQALNQTATLSKDLFANCFKFPPSYKGRNFIPSDQRTVSNKTNIVFQPKTNDIDQLVLRAEIRLAEMGCDSNTSVW
jgi:hypothetical protein